MPPLATPAARTKAPPPTTVTSPPAAAAGGGPAGGNGADVANIDTPGIEFDFPPYTNNIVSQLVRRFGSLQGSLSATVRFVIRRDGSVDLESIKIIEPSGNYPFDQRAEGAVESAANARAFGPLPSAFREDILLVRFRFSPSAIR
ncbi:MAG TPA: energy transducer TonB [Gemmatimonadaceae bacterium]